MTALEIGAKNRFLNNSLQIKGDLYYNDYRGYQNTIHESAFNNPFPVVVGVPARWAT